MKIRSYTQVDATWVWSFFGYVLRSTYWESYRGEVAGYELWQFYQACPLCLFLVTFQRIPTELIENSKSLAESLLQERHPFQGDDIARHRTVRIIEEVERSQLQAAFPQSLHPGPDLVRWKS